jgi:hypothetical protein
VAKPAPYVHFVLRAQPRVQSGPYGRGGS